MASIKIKSFDPLVIEIDAAAGALIPKGDFSIMLPDLSGTLINLSMNGMIPGNPRIVAEHLANPKVSMTLPGDTMVGEVVNVIVDGLENFRTIHKAYQDAFDEHGAFLK